MSLLTAPILPFPEPLSIDDRYALAFREPLSLSDVLFSALHAKTGAAWWVRWAPESSTIAVSRTNPDGGVEELWHQAVPADGKSIEGHPLFLNIVDQFTAFNERCARPVGSTVLSRGIDWVKAGLHSFVRRPKAIRRGLWAVVKWFLIFMGALLCFTMAVQRLNGYKGVAPVRTSAAAPGNEVVPELRDRSLGDSLTTTEMQVVADVTRQLGVQMRPTGQPFVVFSDPNCPACKDLESKLSQVDPRFVPVIVPVSFKPGSDELVKRVFCAKDTVAAWAVAVGGHEATGDAASDGSCTEASQKALSANAAFTALNFSATPTIVSATGKVVAGSGSIEGINQWLIANGGLSATAVQKP